MKITKEGCQSKQTNIENYLEKKYMYICKWKKQMSKYAEENKQRSYHKAKKST